MMKKYSVGLFFILLATSLQAQDQVTATELSDHVHFLASDELGGRKPGTEGGDIAMRYIRDDFRQSGLELPGKDGFQYFNLITGAEPGANNMMMFGDVHGVLGEDFQPLSFSVNDVVKAPLAFCGYGITFSNDTLDWDEYSGIDVKGKWVMILKADPMADEGQNPFLEYGAERTKVVKAIDQGAAGVIFVAGPAFEEEDRLGTVFYDKSPARAAVPVFQVTRAFADKMLVGSEQDIASLEKSIIDNMKPASFLATATVHAAADVELTEKKTGNVIGLVPGTDPLLKDQFIVIGAHYDHLGMGGPGSGSRVPDTMAVHNGADDNASGVAGVLELAEYFAKHPTKRSLVFMAFGAEESGLVGSKEYSNHPLFPLEETVAMFNFDMIGRMDPGDRKLMIGGTGTSVEGEAILDSLLSGRTFTGAYSPEGFGASDHSSFYIKDVPVFFITTGAHTDYHKPSDDATLLDYASQQEVVSFTADLLNYIADKDEALTFQEAGPKGGGHRGRGYKVTLGILPDFTGQGNSGLGVDGVRPGGPAEQGGMQKGDIIKAIEGQPVTNIYDYMFRLKSLEKGQLITVDVERDETIKVLLISL